MSWREMIIAPEGTHHVLFGQPVYDQRFLRVLKYHDPGLAPVSTGDSAWHIDDRGAAVYPQRFAQTFGFYQGRAAVADQTGWFHILVDGSPLYAERYAWCGNYQEGLCPVRRGDGSYVHLTESGAPAYAQAWHYAGDFRDGVAVIQRADGLHSHIRKNGSLLHGEWLLDLDVFHKGFARARYPAGWTHVDMTGKALYHQRFAMVESFYNGQARVEGLDGGLQVIDEQGEMLLRLAPNGEPLAADVPPTSPMDGYKFDANLPIHRSSTAAVYDAVGRHSGQRIALKAQRVLPWFEQEKKLLRLLAPTGRVPLLVDAVATPSAGYLAMEYIEGRLLGKRDWCFCGIPRLASAYIQEVLLVLERLHALGYLHGDLHPENLMVRSARGNSTIVVLDFAQALPLDRKGRWHGEQDQGLWEFIPPEQFDEFATLTPATDTYTAAALFLYLLRGKAPFAPSTKNPDAPLRERYRRAHIDGPDLNGLPEPIEELLDRALAPEPAERYQTARELRLALAAAMRGEP